MSVASSSRLLSGSIFAVSRRRIASPIANSSRTRIAIRSYASETSFDPSQVERATDEVDVCIVGGGPAGLSAAIRIKQLEKERGGDELRVVVLEKGSEVGMSASSFGDCGDFQLSPCRFPHPVRSRDRASCTERAHTRLERAWRPSKPTSDIR